MAKPEVVAVRHVKKGRLTTVATLHEKAIELAEKAFKEHGRTAPVWMLRSDRGGDTLVITKTPWESREEHNASIQVMHRAMLLEEVKLYSFVCQAQLSVPSSRDNYTGDLEDVLLVRTFDKDNHSLTTRYGLVFPSGRQVGKKHRFGVLLARDDWGDVRDNLGGMGNLLVLQSHPITTRCPVCGQQNDVAAEMLTNQDNIPNDGDISMCFGCGAWMVFDQSLEGRLRRPNMDEFLYIAEQADLKQLRHLWAEELGRSPR